ncbi:hypothetical protein PAXINDRAFT_180588 [Paxillus involutus ATCC 200175]|uniref:FAD dependent oxidoreductase domain-containing protein n=1 Tax=Paxillus involutus ATCC 200175 TaxID=664439 RepID=A0A0C9TIG2_PAXIN|nr:hypothetical protein PAXINDRAFT_180588 [Paxillus involutus ATCC 200175]
MFAGLSFFGSGALLFLGGTFTVSLEIFARPTEDGIVKLAIHAAGHTHMVVPSVTQSGAYAGLPAPPRKISTPRTITSHPTSGDGLRVPRSALEALREQIRRVYPELAEKSWAGTRMCCEREQLCDKVQGSRATYAEPSYMCRPLGASGDAKIQHTPQGATRGARWTPDILALRDSLSQICMYTDSPDGDWVIGPYPGDPTLFLATSGSGHGFKFLPNIGRLVADSLEGTLDTATAARFAIDRDDTGAENSERVSQVGDVRVKNASVGVVISDCPRRREGGGQGRYHGGPMTGTAHGVGRLDVFTWNPSRTYV